MPLGIWGMGAVVVCVGVGTRGAIDVNAVDCRTFIVGAVVESVLALSLLEQWVLSVSFAIAPSLLFFRWLCVSFAMGSCGSRLGSEMPLVLEQ